MKENKKIYFASDFHLGIPNNLQSNEREKVIVAWLDKVKIDAKEIYLVGDLFDFGLNINTLFQRVAFDF